MLCNINDFRVLFPSIVDHASKLIDDSVQTGNIQQVGHIEISNRYSDLFDEGHFLLAIFDDKSFGCIDAFFKNGDGNGKRGMVPC